MNFSQIGHPVFHTRMVTYEFIISSAGAQKAHDPVREALRQQLRDLTKPILRDRIQPFVWARYPKAGAVCHSMIRRYLEKERRSHDTHWDIPSYVSVVVSLDSTHEDFEGGFFVTTGNGEKSFIPLQKGDTVVHQSDLLHGVHVVSGQRWSWAMWFQDSSDCSSAAENWWQAAGFQFISFRRMDQCTHNIVPAEYPILLPKYLYNLLYSCIALYSHSFNLSFLKRIICAVG